jgi:antagonist of KipI
MDKMSATAIRAGFMTSVQDLGRAGLREFGVSPGGALDPHALRVANLLVGNEEAAAGLEVTFGGLRIRFADDRVIAWCGGDFEARAGSISLAAGHAAFVRSGEDFSIESPAAGCRAWLAISGGIDVPVVLGSRATDLKVGFGGLNGRAIRDGDELPLGQNPERATSLAATLSAKRIAPWKPPHNWSNPAQPEPVLRFIRGNTDRCKGDAMEIFGQAGFFVSPDSDRMGVRLDGPRLEWNSETDVLSEAVAPGTVQIPPNGKPILLLNDCQTIGGYPRLAHVITCDLSIAAQLRPADTVHFNEVAVSEAHRVLSERERDLEQFRRGIEWHFK